MGNIFYITIFILSIIISHLISKNLNFIGTVGGIIKLKFGIWIAVFACLYIICSVTGIMPAKETRQEIVSEKNEDKQNDNEDNKDYGNNRKDSKNNKDGINIKSKKYILPGSNKKKLDKQDLEGLSKQELRIARNEIYARHGRIFNDKKLQDYFESKSWYEGIIPAEEFSDSEELNKIERENILFIKKYEEK